VSRSRHLIRVFGQARSLLYIVNLDFFCEGIAINYLSARRTKLTREIKHFFAGLFFTVSCVVFSPQFQFLVFAIILIIFASRLARSCDTCTAHFMLAARTYSTRRIVVVSFVDLSQSCTGNKSSWIIKRSFLVPDDQCRQRTECYFLCCAVFIAKGDVVLVIMNNIFIRCSSAFSWYLASFKSFIAVSRERYKSRTAASSFGSGT